MKVLAVAHVAFEGVESFGEVLKARGAEITEIVSCLEDISAVDAKEYDLAVVCGGSMGVYQADIFPYLNNEIKFIEQRLKNNLPIIGICLGSQLMAKALGAQVFATAGGAEKCAACRAFGADRAIDHLSEDFVQVIGEFFTIALVV